MFGFSDSVAPTAERLEMVNSKTEAATIRDMVFIFRKVGRKQGAEAKESFGGGGA